MTKKILLISPFFFPEKISTGKYNTFLATTLKKSTTQINVITSHPIYPNWRPKRSHSKISGIEIYRGGSLMIYPKSSILRRAFLEIWFSFHSINRYLYLRNKCDIILPVFPPSLFFILINLFKPKKTCSIGIVHDLQGVYSQRKTSNIIYFLINKIVSLIERKSLQSCNYLIFLSKSMKDRAIENYRLIPEFCSVNYPFVTQHKKSNSSKKIDLIFNKNKFNFVYSGALGEKQNPEQLFILMDRLSKLDENIDCHIFSEGPIFTQLRNRAKNFSSKVFFHHLVDEKFLNQLYSYCDLQVIPQAFGTSEGSIPSKLPNLLASSIKILAICEKSSELSAIVNNYEAGVVIDTWDIDEIINLFLINKNYFNSKIKPFKNKFLKEINIEFNINMTVKNILNNYQHFKTNNL